MEITIEDNSSIYIYLKSISNHQNNGQFLSDVRCNLLYDESDNWIGLKLYNTRDNTNCSVNGVPLIETIELPTVGYVDLPCHQVTIVETEEEITIMFDGNAVVHREIEDECNIDLCEEGILGIEIISRMSIGNKDVIRPFLVRDEALSIRQLVYRDMDQWDRSLINDILDEEDGK